MDPVRDYSQPAAPFALPAADRLYDERVNAIRDGRIQTDLKRLAVVLAPAWAQFVHDSAARRRRAHPDPSVRRDDQTVATP